MPPLTAGDGEFTVFSDTVPKMKHIKCEMACAFFLIHIPRLPELFYAVSAFMVVSHKSYPNGICACVPDR